MRPGKRKRKAVRPTRKPQDAKAQRVAAKGRRGRVAREVAARASRGGPLVLGDEVLLTDSEVPGEDASRRGILPRVASCIELDRFQWAAPSLRADGIVFHG